MITIVLQHPEDSLRRSREMRTMESLDSLPSVQWHTGVVGRQSILPISDSGLSLALSAFPVDKEYCLSWISGDVCAMGRAGPRFARRLRSDPRASAPGVSVITGSNSRERGPSPSSGARETRPSRVAHPDASASGDMHLPTTPAVYHLELSYFGIALHRTDDYSINSKIDVKENNMQSVKLRLVLDKNNHVQRKGIEYLIFDIFDCVPRFIKDNYKDVDASVGRSGRSDLGEPEDLEARPRRTGDAVVGRNSTSIVRLILRDRNVGRAPKISIPVLKNAITVQGIVYGRPHSHSFNPNLIYSGEAPCPLSMNKSDYAFIDETRIIIRSVLIESETVSRKLLVYLNLTEDNEGESDGSGAKNEVRFPYLAEESKNSNISHQSLVRFNDDNKRQMEECPVFEERPKRVRDETETSYETFENGEFTFKSLLKLVEGAPLKLSNMLKNEKSKFWNYTKILGLVGGGESSLNAASGWGSPPSANNNGVGNNWGGNGNGSGQPAAANNIQQQWSNANQRPPTSQDGNTNKANNVPSSGAGGGSVVASSGPTGNWGTAGPNANMPASSQPNNNAQPLAPSQANNGGNNSPGANGNGAPPIPSNSTVGPPTGTSAPPTTSKAQLEQLTTLREALFSQDGWGGHVNQDTNWDVPTSPEPGVKLDQAGGAPVWKPNINNGTDLWEANLRNGGQPPPQPVAKTPWGHTPTTNIGGTWGEDDDAPETSNVWTGPPPPQQWGGGPPHQPPHWNSTGKKDDWVAWGEPHRPDLHRPDMHGRDLRAPAPDHRDMRAMMNMDGRGDMRGDPRGISGRLNGTPDMWGQHHGMPHGMQAPNKMMPANVGNGIKQWAGQGPKDMNMAKGVSGWEEPSPPAARRNMPNFDDGTSLWGQQRNNAIGVTPWKEMSGGMGRGAMQCPPVMPPNRMPGIAPNPMKPDAMWGHPHRNGSWEENSAHSANWEKDGVNSWNDTTMNQGAGWAGQKSKPIGAPAGSWESDIGDWGGAKPPGAGASAKLLPKDMIWNSKQFRLLVDMGYKKDDVELALRNRDMNLDEAMDLLAQMRGGGSMDTWRRHDEHPGGPPFDHPQQYPAPPRHQPPSFPPPQQPPSVPFPQPNQGQSAGSGQPSTAQLRMLVQQIQMAVSAGYLNHQILNQPLAPQTLVLLNQLLQQIKLLQQLGSQQTVMQNSMGANNNSSVNLTFITSQINKAKGQIMNLQGQIAAQQAIYIKQQGGGGSSATATGDFFKPQDPLSIPQLQNNFADLTLNKDTSAPYGSSGGQQSRLNQWKLPSLDKDEASEFSRAPGTTTKSNTSPQLNPLALQPDSTWSTGRSVNDGWPSNDTSDLPDGKEPWPPSQQPQSTTYTDLVPEFEPGKPWKGNQMKSIEDDPAITPGSIVRSPLSLAAIKDTDIFGTSNQSKASPTTPSERSLSSSTWSYPPPSSTPNSFNMVKSGGSKTSWGEASAAGPSELWGSGTSMQKSRGPLPTASTKASSSWGGTAAQPQRSSFTQQSNWQQHQSTWLLLRNLTAQIDGSTLKTLCMQHGPLQSFHLYLNQGIALSKYSSREEASKAQTALNNCVLGNTTISAESPAESDVNMILQHLGQGAGGSQWRNSGGKSATGPSASDTWNFNSLWDATTLTEQRATPSSLSTFLPPDLLGGESI